MSCSKDQIPFPNQKFKPNANIPSSLVGLRLSISSSQLMNSTNNIHDYIEALFNYTYKVSGENSETTIELFKESKKVPYIDNLKGSVPWINYNLKSKTNSINNTWSVYDEIMVSIISLSLIYNSLTYETLNENYVNNRNLSDITWKKSNNLLKASFSYLNVFKDEVYNEVHADNFNYIYHLNLSLIQLIIVLKNIFLTYSDIESKFGDFDKVPDRVTTYVKIIVFIHNEYLILDNIQKGINGSSRFETFKNFLEILYCYYLSLEYYSKNQLGISLGLVEYGLVNSIEQDPIRAKLKLNFKHKTELKEKQVFKEVSKLKKQFTDDTIPEIFKQNLNIVIKLLKTLKVKFSKENNNLTFDKVLSTQEVATSYLFSSNNLPNGLQVPLNDVKLYTPSCLQNFKNSGRLTNYF